MGINIQLNEEQSSGARPRWEAREQASPKGLGEWMDGWNAQTATRQLTSREVTAAIAVDDVQAKAGFPAVIDLATLDGTNGFRLDGIDALDESGRSVSSAGDVNGDGFDDNIIGARGGDPGGDSGAGESYVVFGKAGGFTASLDLAALNGLNGFRIDGIDAGDISGDAVSSAGDVNGDGLDDLIIGASFADPDGDNFAGETYVVFGEAGEFAASIDLSALDGSNGFRLDGIDAYDFSGRSVSSAGDVNGDGFDDIIIGALGGDSGGEDSGESYVVFGKAGSFAASLDLATLDGNNGFRIDGIELFDISDAAVSSAGDVNGDGFDDIMIGARYADRGFDINAGESYVVFGKAGGFAASLDLASLDGNNGFHIDGIDASDYSGRSVSSAGDVNGDGFDDIMIGAYYADPGSDSFAGESYVVFGKAGGFTASLDLATLNGSNGFRIDGVDAYDNSGYSVSSAGDVNGDGFDDIIIGARYADPGGDLSAGESYIVFGKAGGFAASLDLASLDGANGFRLDGIDTEDYSGRSVSSAGDVDGDGFDDMIIGATGGDINAGESYVVFGRAPAEAVRRIGSEADQEIRGGDLGDTLGGRGGDDRLVGDGGDDRLFGGLGTDTLTGGGGGDRLMASTGRDVMTGNAGVDSFALDDDLDKGERATITDFMSGTDLFEIDAADFGGGLAPGALDRDAFVVNTTGRAQDAEDRFIYNSTNGKLFYDADGTGAGDAVLLARLSNAPAVVAGDFLVI